MAGLDEQLLDIPPTFRADTAHQDDWRPPHEVLLMLFSEHIRTVHMGGKTSFWLASDSVRELHPIMTQHIYQSQGAVQSTTLIRHMRQGRIGIECLALV